MSLNAPRVRHYLKEFKFEKLFLEDLGWDHPSGDLVVEVDARTFSLTGLAQKRNVQIFLCEPDEGGSLPDYATRRKIEKQVTKTAYEHLLIFVDMGRRLQIWQWVSRQPGQPVACREHRYSPASQSGDSLIQKLDAINFPISEEEGLTLIGVTVSLRDAFDRDRLTKRFYDFFKKEHSALVKFVSGIEQQGDREWYAALMLNRLMFVYFIQRKGFLDSDRDYLRNRLEAVRELQGENKFQSFYRYFLLRLFHEGFSQQPDQRAEDLDELVGQVPYLNGGLFEQHDLEATNSAIDIPDEAFERLFDFFDKYDWYLDTRPLQSDNEINPDVLGYIFEKYINQKQMGAYYTKEDITDYIGKNTIVPYLLDATAKNCAIAFEPAGSVWRLLRKDPDRYLYPAVRKGVIDEYGDTIPLPEEIARGIDDVGQRSGWNRPADASYALPTETWREHVARRQRCIKIRDLLADGKVHTVSDLITYNLNIRQFAEDVVSECEGPDLLRAFFKALSNVTVLDPTCGSGAFLFAALNILDPLYEACLVRMEGFVDDLDRSDVHHRPEKFSDFRQALAEVERHPNRRYFILKSIIVNNLYGVDIMDEAVEICKLRLFLKLVAQVDKAGQLEPLPDIDFNIRAGNTLIGFVRLADIRKAAEVEADASCQGRLVFGETEDALQQLEEDAEIVDRAFKRFHEMQTRHEMDAGDFVSAKQELRTRLRILADELDRYLAVEYGIDREDATAFEGWRSSHQPFHWFAEFYGIMSRGGFDVIIGNPPYIEMRAVTGYQTLGFQCLAAGNLYALVLERCNGLVQRIGRQGYIVPVSSVSTDRYSVLQEVFFSRDLWYSSFDDRPSRLFEGLEHIRLTIHLMGKAGSPPQHHSSRYNKWNSLERPSLFDTLRLVIAPAGLVKNSLPKLTSSIEARIAGKLAAQSRTLSSFFRPKGRHSVFYSRKVGYFLQVLDFEPLVLDGNGQRRPPSEFKELRFDNESLARIALCCLNSNLFYWFITVFSDCRHVNKREINAFPIDLSGLEGTGRGRRLQCLASDLMTDLEDNSVEKIMSFAHDTLTVQCILPKASKLIIDCIDAILGEHYGLTTEEVDFVVNYDYKYRVGPNEQPTGNPK